MGKIDVITYEYVINYFHVCLILETDRNCVMFGMKLFSKSVIQESTMSINLNLFQI
jgi:hypothetical protein